MSKDVSKLDNQIKRLYLRSLSGPVISAKLKVPLGKVYSSLKRNNIRRRTASIQNKIRFENKPLSFDFKTRLSQREKDLMIAGAMLYYGEGAKTQNTVDFANSDPSTLVLFIKFLRKICGVDENRLRFYLYCFDDQNTNGLIKFWCSKLGVNKSNFTKPHVRKAGTGLKRKMPFGVLHIRYSDRKLLERILFLINRITNELS